MKLLLLYLVGVLLLAFNFSISGAQALINQIEVGSTIHSMDWNTAQKLLAVATEDGAYIYDADLTQIAHLDGHTPARVRMVSWKPDGSQLITIGSDQYAAVWNYDKRAKTFNEAVRIYEGRTDFLTTRSVEWSPDGTQLALMRVYGIQGADVLFGAIDILDADNWKLEATIQQNDIIFPGPKMIWNPAQGLLAFTENYCRHQDCRRPHIQQGLFIADTQTGKDESWGESNANFYDFEWSPDGTKLAGATSELRVYETKSEKLITEWTTTFSPAFVLNWSADSNKLLTITYDGIARIHDITQAEPVFEFKTIPLPDNIIAAYWDTEGQRLYIAIESGNLSIRDANFDYASYKSPTPLPSDTPTPMLTPSAAPTN